MFYIHLYRCMNNLFLAFWIVCNFTKMTIANDPLLDIHNHLTNNEFEIWLEGNC